MEQKNKKQELGVVWNTAVMEVGGMVNTEPNFMNIAREFLDKALQEGYPMKEVQDYVNEHYESVAGFFVR